MEYVGIYMHGTNFKRNDMDTRSYEGEARKTLQIDLKWSIES